MKRAIVLLGAALAFSNAAYAAQASSKPTAKQEQEIRDAAHRYEQAWKRGDVQAMSNEYTNDATYLSADGTEAKGKQEISQRINEQFTEGNAKGSQLTLNVGDIQMLSPNMALIDVNQRINPAQAGTGGTGAGPQELHTVVVGVKQGNVWKIKALRSLPAPGTQAAAIGGTGQQQPVQQQPSQQQPSQQQPSQQQPSQQQPSQQQPSQQQPIHQEQPQQQQEQQNPPAGGAPTQQPSQSQPGSP